MASTTSPARIKRVMAHQVLCQGGNTRMDSDSSVSVTEWLPLAMRTRKR